VFTKTSLIKPLETAVDVSPVMFGLSVATQENDVAEILDWRLRLTLLPEHNARLAALVITGVGLTVTVTSCEGPEHPLSVGITV
jgi:hypothetical protein